MESNIYLFIGGCADGQRIRINTSELRILVLPYPFPTEPETYLRVEFRSVNGSHNVFMLSGMSQASALNSLIAHGVVPATEV